METKRINCWVVITILLLSSYWAIFFYIKSKDIDKSSVQIVQIPYKINNWQGKDVTWNQEEKERIFRILQTDKILLRTYKRPNDDNILLYIVCSKKRISFHPPEYCYEGSGAELSKKEIINIPIKNGTLLVNKMVFQKTESKELVVVWYMVDKQMYASYYRQQLNLILNALKGRSSRGMMVRISAYISGNDQERTLDGLKTFIGSLVPYLLE